MSWRVLHKGGLITNCNLMACRQNMADLHVPCSRIRQTCQSALLFSSVIHFSPIMFSRKPSMGGLSCLFPATVRSIRPLSIIERSNRGATPCASKMADHFASKAKLGPRSPAVCLTRRTNNQQTCCTSSLLQINLPFLYRLHCMYLPSFLSSI